MRLLALLPLAFFAFTAAHNVRAGTPHMLFWVCNVSNILLAVALAARWPRGIWIATLWVLSGTPLWILDAWLTRSFTVHSFFTHIVAAVIGILVLRRLPPPAPRGLWWQAVLFGLGCQLLARLFTPAEANVNIAFATYHSMSHVLPGFAAGWLFSLTSFIVAMIALEIALRRIASPSRRIIMKP
jgi:hypothetical protein